MQVYMPWNTSGKAGQETASQLASSHRPVSRHASLKYFLKVAHGGRVIHQMLISRSETGESLKRQNPNLGTCVCVCVCVCVERRQWVIIQIIQMAAATI